MAAVPTPALSSPDAARLLAGSYSGDNAAPLTVGELSAQLKRAVEQGFSHVRVRGEISGFKRAASGHLYFGLKDAEARIDAIIWKGNASRLAFAPEDGLDVIATGKLTTYPGRSSYQIIVDALELAGEGALLALLERTKARLAAEGIFASERKQPLPRLPRTIGIVTSPTGAVIRDILHRLTDRFPVQVLIWPVLVQGEQAAKQIATAIRGFDAMPSEGGTRKPDLLIVARGGGSIEDLWAFNEEAVVRAVADCRIPVISAVGHETDTTLIDFAADARAPTPTAAAEMAVPVRAELLAAVDGLGSRASAAWARRQRQLAELLRLTSARIPALDRLLAPQRQRLDDLAERVPRALRWRIGQARASFQRQAERVRGELLRLRLEQAHQRLDALGRVLRSLDPRSLLKRGYALVTDRAGSLIATTSGAKAAGSVIMNFADGEVTAQVDRSKGTPVRRGRESAAGQANLFD